VAREYRTGGKNMKANASIKLKDDKSAYARAVGGLIALLLTVIVSVLIFWQVNAALGASTAANSIWDGVTTNPGYEVARAARANTSRNATTAMATTVFNLAPLLALVVVAAIILGVILGFGGKRGGV